MKIQEKESYQPFLNCLLFLYMVFVYTNRVFEYINFASPLPYLILGGCGNIILASYILRNKTSKLDFILISLFLAGALTKIIVSGSFISGKTFFLLTSNLGIAKHLFYNFHNKNNILKRIYIILLVVIVYYLFYLIVGMNSKLIHHTVSKNHISVNVIFAAGLLLALVNKEGIKPYFNICIVTISLAIAIWTQSRAGIISSVVFLSIILFFCLKYMKRKYQIIYILIITLILSQIVYRNNIRELFFNVFYRKEFLGDVRFSIFNYYLENLSISSLLSGINLNEIYTRFDLYNIHNSYLSIHGNLGLYGLILIGIYCLTLIKSLYKNKVMFAVLLSIMLRAWSDTILIYYFDFIILFIVIEINSKIEIGKPT